MKEIGTSIRVIDQPTIAGLALEAEHSPRKRSHLLLHSGPDDQVQRLLIVLQPGSYVRPHRHSEQWEVLILLRGRGQLLQFSENGALLCCSEVSVAAPIVQIPTGVSSATSYSDLRWHVPACNSEATTTLGASLSISSTI